MGHDDQPPGASFEDLLDVKVPRQAEDGTWQSVSLHVPTPPSPPVAWGKERFEAQTHPVRWSADILRVVADASGWSFPEVAAILESAGHAETWPNGHDLFDATRRRWLAEQAAQGVSTPPPLYLLSVAELVAKVIYNQTTPRDPFDEDSGWYIAPGALSAAEVFGGDELVARVRLAIDATPGPPDSGA